MPLTIKRATNSGRKPIGARHFLKALLFIALSSALPTNKANASIYFDFRTSTGTEISNQGDGTLCSTGEIVCKYVVINLGRPAADISGIKYYQLNMAGFNVMGGGCGSGALDIAVYNDAAYTSFDHAFALDGSGSSPSFFSASVNFSVPTDKFAQLIFDCNDGSGTAVTLIDGGPGTYVARDINSIRYTGLPNLCVGDTPADCGTTINTTGKIFDFENQSGSISTDIGNGPFGLSIRLGQPRISSGPGIFQVQFFQNGTSGCPDPGYSFQAFADSGYTIPIGTAFKLLTTTDAVGNPISLGNYDGIVIAAIFGAFDVTKYYTLGFASCDASRPISIRGDGSGNYVCTQVGSRFGLFCITAYYEGAFPYLIVSPVLQQIGLQIIQPKENNLFPLNQSSFTTTSSVPFEAGPIAPSATIAWTAHLEYATSGGLGAFTNDRTLTTNEAARIHNETYTGIGGKITVNASQNTPAASAKSITIFVVGTAIPDSDITNRLVNLYGGATPNLMTGIAVRESSYRQFTTRSLFGISAFWPTESPVTKLSPHRGSHIGLMQMPLSQENAWDWLVNTSNGVNFFVTSKLTRARQVTGEIIRGHPGLRELSGTELEHMALVLYGQNASSRLSKQYYAPAPTSSGGWDWVVNTAGNPQGVAYADFIFNSGK